MAARTGKQYLEGLKDDRRVWFGDAQIDVLTHPDFAGSRQGVAGYFDWQNTYREECLVEDEVTGAPMSASLVIPKCARDLEIRHRCLDRLAKYSYGMLGRTPDYLNVTVAGLVARSDMFADGSRTSPYAERLTRFYRDVVEGDLALTHTIIQPAIDKSVGDLQGLNGEIALRAVRRNETGVVLRGAKVLATLSPFADEIFVYPQVPLPQGTDPAYALCFSIPMATKGLITVCRDHYGTAGDKRDHPFSSRFDEQDGFMIFDDVEVPYERLFIDCNLEAYNRIRDSGWAANAYHQTSIRAANKLEFAHQLSSQMAKLMNSESRTDYAAMLGEIWTYAQLTRSAIKAAEAGAYEWGNGAVMCDDRPLRALRDVMPAWMARVNEIVRTIGSHNLIATPSLRAFDNPEMAQLLERYLPGAGGAPAQERAQVFRTAWDFVGSALGGRVELYEKFYLASQPRNYARDHILSMQDEEFGRGLQNFLQDLTS